MQVLDGAADTVQCPADLQPQSPQRCVPHGGSKLTAKEDDGDGGTDLLGLLSLPLDPPICSTIPAVPG